MKLEWLPVGGGVLKAKGKSASDYRIVPLRRGGFELWLGHFCIASSAATIEHAMKLAEANESIRRDKFTRLFDEVFGDQPPKQRKGKV